METHGRNEERQNDDFDVQASWQAIFDLIPAGAYTCDAEGLITYFNPQAKAIWGRAPKLEDPADRWCGSYKMFSADDGKLITHDRCWMALALQEGCEYNRKSLLIERPDGSRVTSRVHANPLRNEQGKIIGAVNLILCASSGKGRPYDDAALAMIEVVVSGLSIGLFPPPRFAGSLKFSR